MYEKAENSRSYALSSADETTVTCPELGASLAGLEGLVPAIMMPITITANTAVNMIDLGNSFFGYEYLLM